MEPDEAANRIKVLEDYIYKLEAENAELTREVLNLRYVLGIHSHAEEN